MSQATPVAGGRQGSSSQLHTADPKHSPGRTLLSGYGKKQNRASVRKDLRMTSKLGGPRKRM